MKAAPMNSGSNIYWEGVFAQERSYPTARLAEAKQMQIQELQSALAKILFAVRPRISAEQSKANTNESTSFGSRGDFMHRQGGDRNFTGTPSRRSIVSSGLPRSAAWLSVVLPNHSVNRTSFGKPQSAGYLKRCAAQADSSELRG